MRFTRIMAGAITAGLVGLVPVSISSPASATENLTTTTVLEQNYGESVVEYGDEVSLVAAVNASNGSSAPYGTVTLYVYTPANPVWTPVETIPSGGYAPFTNVKPVMNASYKAVFSGSTATATYQDNYAPSESVSVPIGVKRKAVFKTPGLYLVGKVSPDFAKKKVVLKRKKGKKYVAWKKVRTNAKGQFRVKAPNQRGFKFSVTIPADSTFTGFTDYYQVY